MTETKIIRQNEIKISQLHRYIPIFLLNIQLQKLCRRQIKCNGWSFKVIIHCIHPQRFFVSIFELLLFFIHLNVLNFL